MASDEKDLGCRPVHAGLLALADKMDEKKREILTAHEPELAAAKELLKREEHAAAALLYDIVAAAFERARLPLEQGQWRELADKCRKAAAKRKGRRR